MKLDFVKIEEHERSGYAARTEYNAKNSDLTIIFVVEPGSAGTKMTKKLAGPRTVIINMTVQTPASARKIVDQALREFKFSVINIAGNGIVHFSKESHPWKQEDVNLFILEALRGLKDHPVKGMRSGGQTGADLAGIVAGQVLGIKTIATFPKNFVQRYENGKDISHTKEEIEAQILHYVQILNGFQETLGI